MPLTFSDALQRVSTIPTRFVAFGKALRLVSTISNFILLRGGIILLIFIIHQLFFWLSEDPEKAFNFATLVIDVIEVIWDIVGLMYNPVADLFNAAVIPLWNALTFYVVEPTVFLVLEVFSLVFLRHKYEGVIKEADFPYGGFVCDDTEVSAAWCGRFGAYNERLITSSSVSSQNGAVFGATAAAAAAAAGRQLVPATITFGIATARRLSEISGEANVDVPSFDTAELVGSLDGLSTQAIVMGGSSADLFFGVLYNIFSTSAVFIFDAVFTVLKTLFQVLKMIIKSGILQFIIGIGLDFILIVGFEIYLPLLFAGIDALVCLLQFLQWNSWAEQLECAETKCFQGPDASADWWMFTSTPIVIQRFAMVVEATLNSRTGRSMTGSAGKIDIGISKLNGVFPSLSADGCTSCFVCKFPELRLLWFVTAATVSLLNQDNFETMYGNVTQKCMANGSYYTNILCGPRGAEDLSYQVWATRYPHGYAEFDIDLVQAYAADMYVRGKQMSAAAGGESATLAMEAGISWFHRDPTRPQDEQASRFYYLMCRQWRHSDAGALVDESPHRYADFTPGSVAYITSSWAFMSCKRFKYEVYGDFSRAIHAGALDVAMCAEDQVQCKKNLEHCIGGCAGDSTSNLLYDFSTTIAISDLNADVVGEDGFASAHADCNVKTDVIEFDFFEGGDSFLTYATRMQLRSGMTALSNVFCEENPISCNVIQDALEKAPSLVFVPGTGWRHRFDMVPPSPPPPPLPTSIAYGPKPPNPSPPPLQPPPYYISEYKRVRTILEPFCMLLALFPSFGLVIGAFARRRGAMYTRAHGVILRPGRRS